MAIGPRELERNLVAEAKNFEYLIDENLKGRKIIKGSQITVDKPRGMTYEHFPHIRKTYQEVGWTEVKWLEGRNETTLLFRY